MKFHSNFVIDRNGFYFSFERLIGGVDLNFKGLIGRVPIDLIIVNHKGMTFSIWLIWDKIKLDYVEVFVGLCSFFNFNVVSCNSTNWLKRNFPSQNKTVCFDFLDLNIFRFRRSWDKDILSLSNIYY